MVKTTRQQRTGLTLVELLVVVALIAILTTTAAIQTAGATGRNRLRSAARQLAGMVALARQQAVLTGQTCTVHYDLERRTVRLETGRSANTDQAADTGEGWVLPAGVRVTAVTALGGVQVMTGSVDLTVNSLGLVPPHAVILTTARNQQCQVRFDGVGGKVHFAEGRWQ